MYHMYILKIRQGGPADKLWPLPRTSYCLDSYVFVWLDVWLDAHMSKTGCRWCDTSQSMKINPMAQQVATNCMAFANGCTASLRAYFRLSAAFSKKTDDGVSLPTSNDIFLCKQLLFF
jgi:hypothetical protein